MKIKNWKITISFETPEVILTILSVIGAVFAWIGIFNPLFVYFSTIVWVIIAVGFWALYHFVKSKQ